MEIKKEYIFKENTFFPSCHASTVLPLSDSSVLAAWFAGTKEGNRDVRIWVAKRENGRWRDPICLPSEENIPHWNPVLLQREDGSIRLFFKYGETIPGWITKYSDSFDGGNTWTAPEVLVPGDASGGRGPVKNKCLRTANGALLAPASTEQRGQWRCFIDRSYDDGNTWQKSGIIKRPRVKPFGLAQMIQPTLWEDDTHTIHALMRTNKGAIYKSCSLDGGSHWTKAERTTLPNNNSGIDCVKSDDGSIWLVCNPISENWGDRTPLHLLRSLDNGKTFALAAELEKKTDPDDEYSYPAITVCGNTLYITYTYNRKSVVYCRITF